MLNPNLISNSQIETNKKRTAKFGLISLLSSKELNQLALKHYGIYKNNKLIAYECPYTGTLLTSKKDIVIEHIIPISSGGGTILFNCIPTSSKINGLDEKGCKHLLTWWFTSKNYKYTYTKERLLKLLNYIFEAYNIVFNNYSLEELETSSLKILKTKNYSKNYNLDNLNKRKEIENNNLKISYFTFLTDCIEELKNNNVDVTYYINELNNLINLGIFKEIDRYIIFQNILKKIIENKLKDQNKNTLTYLLNIDIKKIMLSINFHLEIEIELELINRINNLEKILNNHNLNLIIYLENIRYNLDILSKKIKEITLKDETKLIKNLTLSKRVMISKLSKYSNLDLDIEDLDFKIFLNKLKSLSLKKNQKPKFKIILTKSQLYYLATSKNKMIKDIYLEIVDKSCKYNIYKKDMLVFNNENLFIYNKYFNYYQELKSLNVASIRELDVSLQIKLYKKYKGIVKKSLFINLIEWLEANPYDIPSSSCKSSLKERNLSFYIQKLLVVRKDKNSLESFFIKDLTKKELEYMASSNNEVLLWLYYERYKKALDYNIHFEGSLIPEYKKRPLKEHIMFKEMLKWFLNNPGNCLPNSRSKDLKEREIGEFYQKIKTFDRKAKNSFKILLTKHELEILATSTDQRLLRCYEIIYDRATSNNIYIPYFQEPKRVGSVNSNKFWKLLNWFLENPNSYPSTISNNELEREIANIYQAIKTLDGHKKEMFQMNLTKSELSILALSTKKILKDLYKEILFKSVKYNIYDESIIVFSEENKRLYDMYKNYYLDIKQYGKEELKELELSLQIAIFNKYPEMITEQTSFIKLVNWLNNNSGYSYKERKKAKNDLETKIGSFWWRIKNIPNKSKKSGKLVFKKMLSKEELKYMYLSTDVRLKNCYNLILKKAINNQIVINYYPDEVLKELKKSHFAYYKIVKKNY